ncbi:39S ribosomal protein L10, mitochondrial [Hypomesus transpacificus]|uniref:39S ribosomal protein L10, mitochondrial n=1 Tax=Hypomesus transpacificus TaxID=137520 RepID=UPI001F07D315|nr:39S ribosomal protein L10, mitochondrial [Hypomesus transpacificus]
MITYTCLVVLLPVKMAATLCGKLLQSRVRLPLTHNVRHMAKAVTRHRKPMHIIKQKLLALTEYIPPKPLAPPGALTPRARPVQEESALALILKRDVKTMFQECKMIAVIQDNATNTEDMLLLKKRLHKHGITIKFIPNQVMKSFLPGSPYSNLMPLFIGQTVLFVSKEPKVKEMLVSLRSSPQMVLLGACVDNTLLSPQGLLIYSRLPSVTVIQGELVSGLTMLTSQTASLLQRHPTHLSALLQQYLKQQSPEAGAEDTAVESSTTKAEEET